MGKKKHFLWDPTIISNVGYLSIIRLTQYFVCNDSVHRLNHSISVAAVINCTAKISAGDQVRPPTPKLVYIYRAKCILGYRF